MVTIEEVYSKLIRVGIQRGYEVIAEFCVNPIDRTFNKKIDIVWSKLRKQPDANKTGSLKRWKIIAAFEIEGYDVSLERIEMHKAQHKRLIYDLKEDFPLFVVLYSRADHRTDPDWGDGDKRREEKLSRRITNGEQVGPVHVVDGRHLDPVFSGIPN